MKQLLLWAFCLLALASCAQQEGASTVITSDINNFWEAYDQITTTKDSAQQYRLLEELYLKKASSGLKAFMEKKGYTPDSYLEAINNFPLFWSSIRENTYKAKDFAEAIETEIDKLKQLYPDLKPAKIYFTIGALLSPGTTVDSMVLIGAETALADSTAISKELPDWFRESLRRYFDSNPIKDVVLLNAHEYVHTQQNTYGYDLLSQSLYEGVAEFISVMATEKPSTTPAIAYGESKSAQVRERFSKEMFSPNWNDWLYNNFDNEFNTRDLGYYVGYAIAEKYYEGATDKKQAVKALIELDFGSENAVESFVDRTGFFSKSLADLKKNYESAQPEVIRIKPFNNGDQEVDPNTTRVVIEFSREMNTRFRGFDYGPLGEENVLSVTNFIGFSEDGKSLSFEVDLKPNQRHQMMLTNQFRTLDGVPLVPYLIDIRTR